MNSIDACLDGIAKVNERILAEPESERRKHIRERTVSVTVPDLATVFDMRLTIEGLTDITHRSQTAPAPRPRVHVTVTVTSDDLVDLAGGRLDPARALLTRRVKVDASMGDLLRLRKLL
ncbi:SCP2 sterol-binding domain-containing protein [Nocardiopsis lambiniae]|uniref:SCP2 sterol-binding domain-containing protein n=1 Tax=Nocardiopsis lambiniae TaxID=3075539 RepID=A0ABU2MCB1_9ACTN|nr:SCP2 sterol-binding domain-containing protein [Nocardiopsis sp. DSM 44743]MDT0330323.1 SCP2 sterol-binding domain-containing protein [Nocardiopsis sp. DSM 44743]